LQYDEDSIEVTLGNCFRRGEAIIFVGKRCREETAKTKTRKEEKGETWQW